MSRQWCGPIGARTIAVKRGRLAKSGGGLPTRSAPRPPCLPVWILGCAVRLVRTEAAPQAKHGSTRCRRRRGAVARR